MADIFLQPRLHLQKPPKKAPAHGRLSQHCNSSSSVFSFYENTFFIFSQIAELFPEYVSALA